MNNVTFIGQLSNATGCAVTLILYQGSTVVWIHHYYNSFNFSSQLPDNSYNVTINGYTQGTLTFDIQGASGVNPPVPAVYPQSINGSFNFQTP
ncbi:hypothetical protein [Mucilaginibacter sp. dw_454]|uniref:hypothetical protein n=1 Tax=Mucilaginibacter sp. dw_454 TaxID=2720079 RepID=UPI001BD5DD67|nr:hypothetical protein [Mucilaginibacter sp. dw_454]